MLAQVFVAVVTTTTIVGSLQTADDSYIAGVHASEAACKESRRILTGLWRPGQFRMIGRDAPVMNRSVECVEMSVDQAERLIRGMALGSVDEEILLSELSAVSGNSSAP